VSRFLSHLAVDGQVSAATQNQALAALLFLYRRVLGRELAWLNRLVRAKRVVRLPVVLSAREVLAVIGAMPWSSRLVAMLMYGSGLRLLKALTLRVKDLDSSGRQITIRRGKGGKDRLTMLPDGLAGPLRRHLAAVRALHLRDLARGDGASIQRKRRIVPPLRSRRS
jgi:integrase